MKLVMKSCLQVSLAQNRHSELWNSCSPVPSRGKLFSVLFRAVIDVFSFQKMPKRLPNIDNDYVSCWYRIYFPEWKKNYTLNRLLAIIHSVKGLWQIEKYCHTPWKFQNSACQWDRVNWLQILTLTPPGRMYAMMECNFFSQNRGQNSIHLPGRGHFANRQYFRAFSKVHRDPRYFSGRRFDAGTRILGFTPSCKLWKFDPPFLDWAFQYFVIFTCCRWGKPREPDSFIDTQPVRVNL